MTSRDEIVAALDSYLAIDAIEDSSLNGLQIEGGAEIRRVALAVDAAQATIDAAVADGCQLLVVHHGLFWGQQVPLTGIVGRRVGASFAGGLSLYAAHLPLDAHGEVGNNVLLAGALGATVDAHFGDIGGTDIGVLAGYADAVEISEVATRLAACCGDPLVWDFGPQWVSRVAVVTGRGGSTLAAAVSAGADCFVTGEPVQEMYHEARDSGIHCLFGGHYATETLGVRALGEWLVAGFGVETVWIDHPTGV